MFGKPGTALTRQVSDLAGDAEKAVVVEPRLSERISPADPSIERVSDIVDEIAENREMPYWRRSKEEYFKLYDHFAATLKRALPNARVGGLHMTDPGLKNGDVLMREFLEHC